MHLASFQQHFGQLDDTRQSAKITYPLFDILFLTLCAVVAGAQGWTDIKEYGEGHLDWFQEHDFLLDGVPADDTIARIIARIKPSEFQQCFINWMKSINKVTEGELIAIDGKTLRSSYDREDRRSTIHMVNAFACANSLVIGQCRTDAKSNEITAIPELIKLLDLKGALVSIDAMGCQKEIANTIIEQQADYVLAVKGNQGLLYDEVKSAFSAYRKVYAENITIEKQRGRIEARSYHVLPAKEVAKACPGWKSLKTLGMAMHFRQGKGKEPVIEYRYYIMSTALTEAQFAEAVRAHWAIENNLHWVLDVSMKEDNCQIYKDHGAQNWAILRQTALNMLRAETTKISIPIKQKRAWMKTAYLEKVISAGLRQMNEK